MAHKISEGPLTSNTFYRELTPFYDDLFPADPETVAFLSQVSGGTRPRVRRVLDAGCGTGAYVRAFHEAGVHTWGTDLSPEMIEIARQRDPANQATYTVADLRDVFTHHAAPFDLIFSIGNTLAHLSDWGAVRNWIETLPAALRTNSGSVVVQFVDLSSLEQDTGRDLPVLQASTEFGPVEMQRRYTRTDDHHYRMDAWLTTPAGESAPGPGNGTGPGSSTREHEISQSLLVLDADRVFAAFRSAGFTEIATYGAFDRTADAPDPSSWMRVVDAHR
ncbi:MAG: methyltransferase domain-containing protein [Spirochaeta sp.]|jgi:glycine/sarcosine N-methyltransferase|nr:methyltransferase domain-containing protein [Spirochaeta sp.]